MQPFLHPIRSLAGVIAGGVTLCGGASAVAALIVGLLAGLGCRRALAHSLYLGLPATAATLYTVGASVFLRFSQV